MREALDWSRERAVEIARGAGLDISTKKIERWEAGLNTPDVQEISQYIQALGGGHSRILAVLMGGDPETFEEQVAYYEHMLRGASAVAGAPDVEYLLRDIAMQLATVRDSAERSRIAANLRAYLAGLLATRPRRSDEGPL